MPSVNDACTITWVFRSCIFLPSSNIPSLYYGWINVISGLPKVVPQSVRLALWFFVYWLLAIDSRGTVAHLHVYNQLNYNGLVHM
uniref:Uncharacterized protein n=1 Tax=Glossina pallidipes TaxID=7398 RepID=A0A1B0AIL8_GLOPL